MANLVFDFLHNYHAGERRDSEPANTYQYDEGHVIEANLPQVITSCEIHYWIRGMEEAEAYVPTSITPNSDGTCTVIGHVPNEYFRTNGELRVYIVVTDGDASLTTYEGRIQVCHRAMPDDYVDDDPENEATRVLTEAQEAAATATAAAETCEEVLESIPEDYSTLSDDVEDLKDGFDDLDDRVTALEQGGTGGGLTEDIKQALLQLAEKVAYVDDDGQDYYDALESALYPPADLVSISCVYTQSGTVYDTDTLDSLKADLVVTAHMSDSTTRTITAYTLSGTLTVGTSVVTVSYGGKSTTFNVTVSERQIEYLYNWDFTNSLVDSVSNREAELKAGSGHNLPTRDSSGLSFIEPTQAAYLGEIDVAGKTIEIDIASFDFKGDTSYHIRLLSNNQYNSANGYGLGAVIWRATSGHRGWTSYGFAYADPANMNRKWSDNFWNSSLEGESTDVLNAFNGKTLKVVYHSDGHTKDLYADGVLVGTINDVYFNSAETTHYSNKIYIAGSFACSQSSGDQCYDMTITGIRVYANEE